MKGGLAMLTCGQGTVRGGIAVLTCGHGSVKGGFAVLTCGHGSVRGGLAVLLLVPVNSLNLFFSMVINLIVVSI